MFRLVIFSSLFLATFAASDSRPKPSEGKIVGGYETDITQVPYQVSVRHNREHCCGGSIIGAKYILTAAHCVEGKSKNRLAIRAGSNYHDKDGQLRRVSDVIKHSNFSMDIGNYDAAILVLRFPLTAGVGVQIATLSHVEPQEREMVLISGWGSLKEGEDWSLVLQAVYVPVISKTFCQERYKEEITITDQMFCAGFYVGGIDACYGDSGGPAVVNGKLAGIVSQGDGCAKPNSPNIYTNVASILTWIAENTNL